MFLFTLSYTLQRQTFIPALSKKHIKSIKTVCIIVNIKMNGFKNFIFLLIRDRDCPLHVPKQFLAKVNILALSADTIKDINVV